MRHLHLCAVFGLFVVALCLPGCSPAVSGVDPSPDSPVEPGDPLQGRGGEVNAEPMWAEIDRLIDEQKMAAALEKVQQLRVLAEEERDDTTYTRALVRELQLQTALGGFETAIRTLDERALPHEPLNRAIVKLFHAHGLTNYLNAYAWEIRQRESVVSDDAVDLKKLTAPQILRRAHTLFADVWETRKSLGQIAVDDPRVAEYLQPNGFPKPVRGTLRDAVTYLWVEMWANSSWWEPAESSRVYQLDVNRLLAAVRPFDRDAIRHPLFELAGLLDDLESWHQREKREPAALEARLERLRRLHAALSRDADRTAIREHLRTRLSRTDRQNLWWSEGKATLADMVRQTGSADALIRARQIALEGRDAHPETHGGKRCAAIVHAIERPSYSLATMSTDSSSRRSIEVTHQQLGELHFRAYRFDIVARIRSSDDRSLFPSGRELETMIETATPDASWSVPLPETRDFRPHRTFVTPPLTDPGGYVILASADESFAKPENRRSAVTLVISDLVLLTESDGETLDVQVRSGDSGETLSGVLVEAYKYDWQRGHKKRRTEVTDADGRVEFTQDMTGDDRFFLVARQGDQTSLDSSAYYLFRNSIRPAQPQAMIYTDRSVYRPGQTVFWKTVVYRAQDERSTAFETLSDHEVEIHLRDASGDEIAKQTVRTNEYGSVSGEFVIPSGRLLGAWSLATMPHAYASIRVEEYKRPTFEVELEAPQPDARLNEPVALAGSALYYFGLPVTQGKVIWRVEREPVFPRWWWRPRPSTNSEVIASGTAPLDENGAFSVEFVPEADPALAEQKGISYRYNVHADLTDEGGETRSANRSVRIGFVAVEASFHRDDTFFDAGKAAQMHVRRTDLNNTPLAGEGRWRLVSLAQPPATLLPAEQPLPDADEDRARFQTPGDRMRARFEPMSSAVVLMRLWEDGAEVARGGVRHDDEGMGQVEFSRLEAGAYRLYYTTEDSFGATFEMSEEFVVVGNGQLALPLLLMPQSHSASVGDTVRVAVHSGLDDQPLELRIFRNGQLAETRSLRSGAPRVLEFPVAESDRGGLAFALVGVRDHQLMQQTQTVSVPWDNKQLDISFETFRDTIRPQSSETWTVKVRSHDEKTLARGAAELLAYMYDKSLDVFGPHSPPDPLSLYRWITTARPYQSNLGQSRETFVQDNWKRTRWVGALGPDRLKFFDRYGIGGPGVFGGQAMRSVAMRQMAPSRSRNAPMALEESFSNADALADQGMESGEARLEKSDAGPSGDEPELRSDFAETAFWEPHLLTGDDGSVTFSFEVPDSVTEWNVYVHGLTRDLRSGSLHETTRSVKELMIRPYVPRFLREGDRAVLEVVVNNASDRTLRGDLKLEIADPQTKRDLLSEFGVTDSTASFTVNAQSSANVRFELSTPPRVGMAAITVVGRAGDFSDGERRLLPLLPGRMHLMQSRFVALRNGETREMHFAELAGDGDPSRIDEQIVVDVDAQLFYGVLNALPYLIEYPYECTEQTLNRFLSTGIVSSVFDQYPAVAEMAKKMSVRDTQFEAWDEDDPNRKMALEETPWLRVGRGGERDPSHLIKVLDPAISRAQRKQSLEQLRKMQTSSGGFPWFPGGPPSPYMTVYILHGFSKALEFDVEVDKDMVRGAWRYLHRYYVDELYKDAIEKNCCWQQVTFLNFVLSSYPDATWSDGLFTDEQRTQMLDFSFKHWKQHSPLLKAQLALTLNREDRPENAQLVFDSIMDSAKTDRDLGTYWAPEDRAWLWYNDTEETHAFALRALTELSPRDERRHGMVQWLMLNKKLNHWKSTRTTAEVIYSLVHYMQAEGQLAQPEAAVVRVGDLTQRFEFDPSEFSGDDARLVIEGERIDPKTMATVVVDQESDALMFATATWHFSTEKLPESASGDLLAVERSYFRRVNRAGTWTLLPLKPGDTIATGDQIEVHLSVRAKHAAEYVHLRDPRAAGMEPESLTSRYRWDLGLSYYEEVRDSGTNFFFEWLPAGEYTLRYRLRANMKGAFKVSPATLQSMYAPEFGAYSSGARLEIGAP